LPPWKNLSNPSQGQATLMIRFADIIHKDIKKRAEETNRNIREYVEYLIAKYKSVKAEKYYFADENVQSA
jgi:hypothetical protein